MLQKGEGIGGRLDETEALASLREAVVDVFAYEWAGAGSGAAVNLEELNVARRQFLDSVLDFVMRVADEKGAAEKGAEDPSGAGTAGSLEKRAVKALATATIVTVPLVIAPLGELSYAYLLLSAFGRE